MFITRGDDWTFIDVVRSYTQNPARDNMIYAQFIVLSKYRSRDDQNRICNKCAGSFTEHDQSAI
eukprot:IDg16671t1